MTFARLGFQPSKGEEFYGKVNKQDIIASSSLHYLIGTATAAVTCPDPLLLPSDTQ